MPSGLHRKLHHKQSMVTFGHDIPGTGVNLAPNRLAEKHIVTISAAAEGVATTPAITVNALNKVVTHYCFLKPFMRDMPARANDRNGSKADPRTIVSPRRGRTRRPTC